MAGSRRPSFLKMQKEKKREAKAREKREARQQKRARAVEMRAEGAPAPTLAPAAGDESTDAPPDRPR